MNKTAKILAAVGAAAASAAALTVSTVSDYAINARSKMFADRHAGEAPLPQSRRTVPVTIQNSDGLKLTGTLSACRESEKNGHCRSRLEVVLAA